MELRSSGRAAVGLLTIAEVKSGENLQYVHIDDPVVEVDLVVPCGLLDTKPLHMVGWHEDLEARRDQTRDASLSNCHR